MSETNGETIIGKRVGNYVVERPLAQGGMGSVFVARHPALGREAAVKFLGQDHETPTEFTKRFLDEARITANLRHPNIVDIFDFGELEGRLYYVMELLDGRDLAAVMRCNQRLTCDEVVDFLEQTCAGLAAAHSVGVVHRDLKPGNIFLVRGDSPRLKLMDFGVAKIMSPQGEKTRYGQIIGTPRYMSPEQALGQNDRITPQSDIYSLGTIAYEMLAGVAPFEHDSPVMLLVMHVRDAVRPLREHAPDTPPPLAELIEACLAKDPKERPTSALEILERVVAFRRWSSQQGKESLSSGLALKALSTRLDANAPKPASASSNDLFADADTIFGQQTNALPMPPEPAVASLLARAEVEPSPHGLPPPDAGVAKLASAPGMGLPDSTLRAEVNDPPQNVEVAPSVSSYPEDQRARIAEPAEPCRADSGHAKAAEPCRDDDGHAKAAEPRRADSGHVKAAEPSRADSGHVKAAEPSRDDDGRAKAAEPRRADDGRAKAVEPGRADSGHVKAAEPRRADDGRAKAAEPGVDGRVPAETWESKARDSGAMPSAALRALVTDPGDVERELPAASVKLTDSDRTTLTRLLARMQRRGDFPAFVQNVSEVSKRADCESRFSAQQLGTSILKDYALTAKLLRIVNSSYAARFGGKIYSIQHAIVILGFDRVRSLAITASLFKSQGNKEHGERISDSAINSLVSGEIARQLYADAALDDAEQATVCSVFRNLGRHLVLVYLPESYDQIVELVRREGVSLNQASERVLGISMHKLGVGIAERWRFPAKVIHAMCVIPERTGKLKCESDRLAALADFSNQLCDIVVHECTEEERNVALRTLLSKHRNLVELESSDVSSLVETAQHSFEKRYASLLGVVTRTSRFARSVAAVSRRECNASDARAVEALASGAPVPAAPGLRVRVPAQSMTAPAAPAASPSHAWAKGPQKDRQKPQVARIQLAKVVVSPEGASADAAAPGSVATGEAPSDSPVATTPRERLDLAVERALVEFDRSGPAEPLLTRLLEALATDLDLPRILAMRATMNRQELIIVGGIGEDVDGLMKEFRLPLAVARAAKDPFSLSFHTNRDSFFEDVFTPKALAQLPQRYYEAVGSTSVMILSCVCKGLSPLVLVADLDPPALLPTPEQMAQLSSVRQAIAKVAPNAAHRPPLQ